MPIATQNEYPLVANTTIMLGRVWPDRNVAYPDFLEPTNVTEQWWIDEFVRFHHEVVVINKKMTSSSVRFD